MEMIFSSAGQNKRGRQIVISGENDYLCHILQYTDCHTYSSSARNYSLLNRGGATEAKPTDCSFN